MKLGVWVLITALILWTSSGETWVQDAMATSIGSVNLNPNGTAKPGELTSVSTYTPTNTNTNTVSTKQLTQQQDTSNLNKQGDSSATGLGLAAIAAGIAMMAAGAAMMSSPPTVPAGAALMAAGALLLAAGMAALAAAGKMRNNGNQAANNAYGLDRMPESGVSPPIKNAQGAEVDNTGGSGIKIDPALARNGKTSDILADFEKKTGLSRDDLIDGLNAGKSPIEIMAGAPKVKMSESDLQKAFDKAVANNEALSSKDVMDKLGMTPEDLAGSGQYSQAGGGDRKPNSTSTTDFDALFGAKNAGDLQPTGGVNMSGGTSLSPELQAALDRNGITGRSIFEMVRSQYKKKTPLMFGVKKEQALGEGSRPLFDIKAGANSIEF